MSRTGRSTALPEVRRSLSVGPGASRPGRPFLGRRGAPVRARDDHWWASAVPAPHRLIARPSVTQILERKLCPTLCRASGSESEPANSGSSQDAPWGTPVPAPLGVSRSRRACRDMVGQCWPVWAPRHPGHRPHATAKHPSSTYRTGGTGVGARRRAPDPKSTNLPHDPQAPRLSAPRSCRVRHQVPLLNTRRHRYVWPRYAPSTAGCRSGQGLRRTLPRVPHARRASPVRRIT